MSDIYDAIGKRGGGGDFPDFYKFEMPGAKFKGTVTGVRTHTFKGFDGSDDDPTIILDCIEDGTGQAFSVRCGSTGLHNLVVQHKPVAGDHIEVERGPNAGQAHTWKLTVTKAAAPQAPQAPAPATPPTASAPMA